MFDIYDKSKGGSYSDTLSQSSDDRRDADEVLSLKIRVCERQPNYFQNRYILRTGLLLILSEVPVDLSPYEATEDGPSDAEDREVAPE